MSTKYFWVTVSDKTLGGESYARAESLERWKEVIFKILDGQDVFLSCDAGHAKQTIFTPVRLVRKPKTMSQCMTSPKLGGSGRGLVFLFVQSMVAASPRLTMGSLSMDKMEKFDFAVVERWQNM